MTIDPTTKLEIIDYNAPGWVHIYNSNMDRLNNDLLTLKGLANTTLDAIENGQPIVYDSSISKWVPYTG